jgi:hypothetical protein
MKAQIGCRPEEEQIMKTLAFLSFMLSAAVALNAQTTGIPKPPGVEVLKFSWNKERLGWERDPFNGTNENFHEMRVRARNEKRISDAKGNNPAEVNKLERDARADEAIITRRFPSELFLYLPERRAVHRLERLRPGGRSVRHQLARR